jgi:chromatin remodeling complex protein RSC6
MPAKNSTPAKKPRAKKSSSSSSSSKSKKTEVAAPAPVEVAAPAPVEVAAPAPAPAHVDVVVTDLNEVSTHDELETDFASITDQLAQLKTIQNSIVVNLKRLQRNMAKYSKELNKKGRKKRVEDPNKPKRAPSGFAKPSLISNELCSFLGKPNGTQMARTEVTKYLTQYIKQHNLQDQANRRKIVPDSSLQQLLNVPSDAEVTYFNLQKYMKVHFPKQEATPEVIA